MLGTLDKKRGIVNILIHRGGRKTYLSMDQGLVALGMAMFDGDPKKLSGWIQARVDALDTQGASGTPHATGVNGHAHTDDFAGGACAAQAAPASGFSRLVQREIVGLALQKLQSRQDPGADHPLAQ